METIIYAIIIAVNLQFVCNLDPGGYKVCLGDDGRAFCCFNHEEQNGTCVECEAGTLSINGGPCTECKHNFYGNRCAFECKCTQNQRCDKEVGCVSTDIDSRIPYDPLKVSILRSSTPEKKDIELKCHTDGISDNFTVFRWEHRTLLGQHLRFIESGRTLFLPFENKKTYYYRNGIYSCNVSHGTPNTNGFIFETAQYKLHEKGVPVFMTTNQNIQYGCFRETGTIVVNIWSYPKLTNTEIGSAEKYEKLPNKDLSSNIKYTILQDVLFGRTVAVYGYKIEITFDIEHKDQFTKYSIRVSNEEGFSNFTIDFKSANAPNVSVLRIRTNGRDDIFLKCQANGIPNNITYFPWEHRTQLGQHLRFLQSGETLFLSHENKDFHYYRNGIYLCNVSNGISNDEGVLFQTAQYTVREIGKPVFMTTNKDVQYGNLQQIATIAVNVWSNPKPLKIEIASAETYSELPNEKFSFSIKYTRLKDNIFERTVDIYGYGIEIQFDIEKETQFTNYTIRVSNEEGFSNFTVDFKFDRMTKGENIWMQNGKWIVYSLSVIIVVSMTVIGICFCKYRQRGRMSPKLPNRMEGNSTSEDVQLERNGVYDEIDETVLADNFQDEQGRGNEGVVSQQHNVGNASLNLHPYKEDVPCLSETISTDRLGYLISCQYLENKEDTTVVYDETDSASDSDTESEDTFAKEVYVHHSYQQLQTCRQKSVNKYGTSGFNSIGISDMYLICTHESNDPQKIQESNFNDYTDEKPRASI